jgi:hypothetical protein
MAYEYVNDHYGVNACYGREITVDGSHGVIIEDLGNYIGVNFDDDKPCVSRRCHPTWRAEYGEIITPRKASRGQMRYQAYLRSESSLSFGDWLKDSQ